MATPKVIPFPVSTQYPTGELSPESAELMDAVHEWRSAKCYACGEPFVRQIDAKIHRVESVECDGAVLDLYGPRLVN